MTRTGKQAEMMSCLFFISHSPEANLYQRAYFSSVLSEGDVREKRRYDFVPFKPTSSHVSSDQPSRSCSCKRFCFSSDHWIGSVFIIRLFSFCQSSFQVLWSQLQICIADRLYTGMS